MSVTRRATKHVVQIVQLCGVPMRIGRSALVAACLLSTLGAAVESKAAILTDQYSAATFFCPLHNNRLGSSDRLGRWVQCSASWL